MAVLSVHTPGMLIAAFVPMLFVAFAFRELNKIEPDCGTNFTWAVRAFGPRTGWMSGWGLLAACIVVMSSVSQIAARYAYLLVGANGLRPAPSGSPWVVSRSSLSSPGSATSASKSPAGSSSPCWRSS